MTGDGSRGRGPRRVHVSIAVALAAVGVALAMPSPQPARPPTTPQPLRLAGVWPDAKPVTIPGTLSTGAAYQPSVIVDPTTSIGVANGSDATVTHLVIRTGETVRTLRAMDNERGEAVAAVTVVDGRIFWAETAETAGTADGTGQTTVWRADVDGGAVRRLATDRGLIYSRDSAYDLQVVDGSVYWVTTDGERADVRSVPVDGGPVRVRALDRAFGLTAWPWATTSTTGDPGDVELLNLVSGERRLAPGGPEEFLSCAPDWCRVTTLIDDGQNIAYGIRRPDGSEERELTDTPMNVDVALLKRFELLPSEPSDSVRPYQRLSLYDLTTGRSVVVADALTGPVGDHDDHLWWSTGDNETLQWHVLDLRQLR
jgi:hypothetical protein